MDTGVHTVAVAVINAEELHAAAQFLRKGDILGGNLRNTRHMNLFKVYALAAAEASKQSRLVGRVDTFDIKRRVGFGKTELLGILQDHIEIEAFVGHAAEDVVTSTIDDAAQVFDRRAEQAFLEATDDRNATTHSGFEQHMQALFGSKRENFVTVLGKESLVRSHHMLTRIEGGQNPLARHVVATGQFNEHVDVVTGNHLVGISRNLVALCLVRGDFLFGLCANASKFQFDTQLFLIFGNFLFKNLNNTATDGSSTNESNTQHIASPFLNFFGRKDRN